MTPQQDLSSMDAFLQHYENHIKPYIESAFSRPLPTGCPYCRILMAGIKA